MLNKIKKWLPYAIYLVSLATIVALSFLQALTPTAAIALVVMAGLSGMIAARIDGISFRATGAEINYEDDRDDPQKVKEAIDKCDGS